jgi:hypothetical protein
MNKAAVIICAIVLVISTTIVVIIGTICFNIQELLLRPRGVIM